MTSPFHLCRVPTYHPPQHLSHRFTSVEQIHFFQLVFLFKLPGILGILGPVPPYILPETFTSEGQIPLLHHFFFFYFNSLSPFPQQTLIQHPFSNKLLYFCIQDCSKILPCLLPACETASKELSFFCYFYLM